MKNPELTIIIPTTAELRRAETLTRAIKSCFLQAELQVKVIVVVNGDQAEKVIIDTLSNNKDISVLQLEEGNAPKARLAGLKKVETDYFGFLDDDDEFFKDALAGPLKLLVNQVKADAVIMPGLKKLIESEVKKPILNFFPECNEDPYVALLKGNWLASCGGIYRKSSVEPRVFENLPLYFEWTYTALRLSESYSLYFYQIPTFVIHQTTGSLSATTGYELFEVDFLLDVTKNYQIPNSLKNHFKKKLASKYNTLANFSLKRGERKRAAIYHLKCLSSSRFGLQYLAWTRHLLKP
jgi:glycosyltransferase involved in cell wall biosynthesis